ncbi:esterase [Sphingomonas gei]|uniref:Esterase n=2 Tax=Sphingomonas gei TaxID=1395960 RepID=A0A4S1XM05_9SPHN|nr:esterase [Sphingomonas gei]
MLGLALALVASGPAAAQVATRVPAPVPGALSATIERIKVHSPTIVGNLEGEAADRDVLVVLPPGYARSPKKRYPVLYALHGYSIGAEQWIKEIHVPQTIEGAFAKDANEMIVVLPDSKTVHNGSMYSSSPTTGDFEAFVSRDLVRHIDAHYRTLAVRESRGLAGHSMGGYGTARIGMKHAETFGAIYMMSPCCLSPRDPAQFNAATGEALAKVKSLEEARRLGWGERAQLATAAAWSPNPKNPPLYLDLPVKDGVVRPEILAKWAANAPLAFIDQYVGNLRRYKAIAIDVGDRDGLKDDAAKLHEALDRYGIANSFEIYPGDHTSDVAARFQEQVIPFFSKHLVFAAAR